jgi:hypothetical protein
MKTVARYNLCHAPHVDILIFLIDQICSQIEGAHLQCLKNVE